MMNNHKSQKEINMKDLDISNSNGFDEYVKNRSKCISGIADIVWSAYFIKIHSTPRFPNS